MEIIVYLVIIVVCLCLNGLLASNASDMAQEKGYSKHKWFHMCFWVGPISYIIIAAMPDLKMREKLSETNRLLEQFIGKAQSNADPDAKSRQEADDVSAFLPDI